MLGIPQRVDDLENLVAGLQQQINQLKQSVGTTANLVDLSTTVSVYGDTILITEPVELGGDTFLETIAEIFMVNSPPDGSRSLGFELFLDGTSLNTSFATLASISTDNNLKQVLASPYASQPNEVNDTIPRLLSSGSHTLQVKVTISSRDGSNESFSDVLRIRLFWKTLPKTN